MFVRLVVLLIASPSCWSPRRLVGRLAVLLVASPSCWSPRLWLRLLQRPAAHPARIFFISVSAQAIESFVDVPVTALAIMLGRVYEFVMSWTLSEAGAGHPKVWYWTPSPRRAAYLGSVL